MLIVVDAWRPQINGVVRSIENLVRDLAPLGIDVGILAPTEFRTVPLPGYPVPESWLYGLMRWFHNAGRGCLVATWSLCGELVAKGFRHLHIWSRGVDTKRFHPDYPAALDLPKPGCRSPLTRSLVPWTFWVMRRGGRWTGI